MDCDKKPTFNVMHAFKQCLILGGLSVLFAACDGTSNSEGTQQSLSLWSSGPSEKVSLMKAHSSDISSHVVACQNKKTDAQVCVEVCHRPPGNPLNSKNMVLPLSAAFAHLDHGHSNHPDTLGTCEGSSDGGDDGEIPTDDDGVGTLPVWCEENIDIDADCDGFHDEWGMPIY